MVLSDRLPIKNARVVAENCGDASIPVLFDVPQITVDLPEDDAPPNASGTLARRRT
jgi:hypothetical protein